MRTTVAITAFVTVLSVLLIAAVPSRAAHAYLTLDFRASDVGKAGDQHESNRAVRIACRRVTFRSDANSHASSASSANRRYKDVTIVTAAGKLSPEITNASMQGKMLDATITFEKSGATGGQEHPYTIVKLTNAIISKIEHSQHSGAAGSGGKSTESLTIVFEKIEFTNVTGGVAFNDDWQATE